MKRSPLKRKTPLRRGNSSLKRSPLNKVSQRASVRNEARERHLARYRGRPCAVCGRTEALGKPTCTHHILKAELYPEYYYEEWNNIPQCPIHHIPFAHDKETEFLAWLKKNDPKRWALVEKHRHHRRDHDA